MIYLALTLALAGSPGPPSCFSECDSALVAELRAEAIEHARAVVACDGDASCLAYEEEQLRGQVFESYLDWLFCLDVCRCGPSGCSDDVQGTTWGRLKTRYSGRDSYRSWLPGPRDASGVKQDRPWPGP